jgi:manganese transport protein
MRLVVSLTGPAFVTSVAYVNPGNFAANLTVGAGCGYQLVWVVTLANLAAMLVQYLAAKVGLVTGRSLPELCRARCCCGSRRNRRDGHRPAGFVGAAIGLNLLFGMSLFLGGLVTATIAFALLRTGRIPGPFSITITNVRFRAEHDSGPTEAFDDPGQSHDRG